MKLFFLTHDDTCGFEFRRNTGPTTSEGGGICDETTAIKGPHFAVEGENSYKKGRQFFEKNIGDTVSCRPV